jgi:nucleotide-binding universal stress UspA family protein
MLTDDAPYRKILIANDGSDGAREALRTAIGLAKLLGVELHMVSVEELPRFASSVDEIVEDKQDQNQRFARVIREARRLAEAHGVRLAARVVVGHAVPTIVELIEREGFDLLVVGFMGHSAIYNRLIGSTTDRLVELAPCPYW